MKFGLVGPTFPFRGGIAAHTTLLEHAMRKRHDVVFVSFKRQYPTWIYPGPSDRDESEGGIRPLQASALLDSMNPWTWYQTAKRLVSERVDVVILPWWVIFWAPQYLLITSYLKVMSRIPVIFLCHNVHEHETNRLKNLVTSLVLEQGSAFLCHSEEEKAFLEKHFPGRIVTTMVHPSYEAIANPSDSGSQAASDGLPGEAASPDHRTAHDPRQILFFGFVRPYKGLDVLLEAMPEVHRQTGARLKVVGEAWQDAGRYRRLVAEHGLNAVVDMDLRYVPNAELPSVFDAADLVVLPYRSATGSGAVQLALGAGLPVVATRVGSIPTAVQHETNGLLVPAEDSKSLAQAITRALDPDQWGRLVSGVAQTKEQFSWDRLVDTIEQVASKLLDTGSGSRMQSETK